ncbi:MAG: hypothetical protein HY519_03700 [Candidatus Aenigmarchaeota archaeon]|nr:hypothetical protein [Candidatus Aenigmarchaeota archaeon]
MEEEHENQNSDIYRLLQLLEQEVFEEEQDAVFSGNSGAGSGSGRGGYSHGSSGMPKRPRPEYRPLELVFEFQLKVGEEQRFFQWLEAEEEIVKAATPEGWFYAGAMVPVPPSSGMSLVPDKILFYWRIHCATQEDLHKAYEELGHCTSFIELLYQSGHVERNYSLSALRKNEHLSAQEFDQLRRPY